MKTNEIVTERIEEEREIGRLNKDLIVSGAPTIELYKDIHKRSPSGVVNHDLDMKPFEQLIMHGSIRFQLFPLSRNEFESKTGMTIEVAEKLAEANLIIPIIPHQNAEVWKNCNHLHGLLKQSYCPSMRYQTMLELHSGCSSEDVRLNVLKVLGEYVATAKIAPFGYMDHWIYQDQEHEITSLSYRLTWLYMARNDIYQQLWNGLLKREEGMLFQITRAYIYAIARDQLGLGRPVTVDANLFDNFVRGDADSLHQRQKHSQQGLRGVATLLANGRTIELSRFIDGMSVIHQQHLADRLIRLNTEENIVSRRKLLRALENYEQSVERDGELVSAKRIVEEYDNLLEYSKEATEGFKLHADNLCKGASYVSCGYLMLDPSERGAIVTAAALVANALIRIPLQKGLLKRNSKSRGPLFELAVEIEKHKS